MPSQLANFVYPSDEKAWIIISWSGAWTSSGYMDPPQAKASLVVRIPVRIPIWDTFGYETLR